MRRSKGERIARSIVRTAREERIASDIMAKILTASSTKSMRTLLDNIPSFKKLNNKIQAFCDEFKSSKKINIEKSIFPYVYDEDDINQLAYVIDFYNDVKSDAEGLKDDFKTYKNNPEDLQELMEDCKHILEELDKAKKDWSQDRKFVDGIVNRSNNFKDEVKVKSLLVFDKSQVLKDFYDRDAAGGSGLVSNIDTASAAFKNEMTGKFHELFVTLPRTVIDVYKKCNKRLNDISEHPEEADEDDDATEAKEYGTGGNRFNGKIVWGKNEGKVKDAKFKLAGSSGSEKIIWEEGEWLDGTWQLGIWKNGTWHNGTWKNGIWSEGEWIKGTWKGGDWKDGIWHEDGSIWQGGTWEKGRRWQEGKKPIQTDTSPDKWGDDKDDLGREAKDPKKYGDGGNRFSGNINWGNNQGKVKDAKFKLEGSSGSEKIIWDDGEWLDGTWDNGTWNRGTWHNGTWMKGTWKGGEWIKGAFEGGKWKDGYWHFGINSEWHGGTWETGRKWREDGNARPRTDSPDKWSADDDNHLEGQLADTAGSYGDITLFSGGISFGKNLAIVKDANFELVNDSGTKKIKWHDGIWFRGNWEDGTWQSGEWKTGKWLKGTWLDGTWSNGDWYGGDWKKGTWENGEWHDGDWHLRGDSVWKGGIWEGGNLVKPDGTEAPSSESPDNYPPATSP